MGLQVSTELAQAARSEIKAHPSVWADQAPMDL